MAESNRPDDKPCEWDGLVSAYVLGNLSNQDKLAVERHLAANCANCAIEFANAVLALEKLANSSAATPLPGLRERFLALLDHQRQPQDEVLDSGIIFSKSGVTISRSQNLPWHASRMRGIWTRVLFVDAEQHCVTSIVRLDPGTCYPSHRHGGPEEIFLLTGSIAIEEKLLGPGDYCHAAAGSTHSPSFTDTGCTFILRSCDLNEVPVQP